MGQRLSLEKRNINRKLQLSQRPRDKIVLDIQKAVGKEFQGKGKAPDWGKGPFFYSTSNTEHSLNTKISIICKHFLDVTGKAFWRSRETHM